MTRPRSLSARSNRHPTARSIPRRSFRTPPESRQGAETEMAIGLPLIGCKRSDSGCIGHGVHFVDGGMSLATITSRMAKFFSGWLGVTVPPGERAPWTRGRSLTDSEFGV